MSDVDDDQLQEGIVKFVNNDDAFERKFDLHLHDAQDAAFADNWSRSSLREPTFIENGIGMLHREHGKAGRRKARTAAVYYGRNTHENMMTTDRDSMFALRDEVVKTSPVLADRLNFSPTLEHTRRSRGNPSNFYIRDDDSGVLEDLASLFGLTRSQLIRHYEAICIADADLGHPSETAEQYKQRFIEIVESQEAIIDHCLGQIEGNDD